MTIKMQSVYWKYTASQGGAYQGRMAMSHTRATAMAMCTTATLE